MGMDPISLGLIAVAASSAVGAGASIIQGQQQASAQKNAAQQAKEASAKQADAADQANNRANAKTPDIAAMLTGNQNAAASGGASTMLTGPTGVSQDQLQLGRNTLLGM
ncbi:hypothetical protein D8I24_5675 [Cupriavidus necator H850]|uniref:hypothetical protein n=1 Tax=Cupriavidus necator TaxID=106590 RepID=UPI001E3BCBE3|nr:hypothetical protein [Cupriavidus necator]KAI3598729.1 hypothetical protein D8I24_5675 [Cupriavidus necator H850]